MYDIYVATEIPCMLRVCNKTPLAHAPVPAPALTSTPSFVSLVALACVPCRSQANRTVPALSAC